MMTDELAKTLVLWSAVVGAWAVVLLLLVVAWGIWKDGRS
jgi:hypothetical protein